MEKFSSWLKKVLTDSFTGALTQILAVFFSGVILTFSAVALFTFVKSFYVVVPVPVYILVILIPFSLIGVFIPAFRIINLLNETRRKASQRKGKNKIKVQLKFEDFPREWQAIVSKDDDGLHVENVEVYCMNHNLLLEPKVSKADSRDSRSGVLITSVCSDCKRDGVRYKENSYAGYVLHSRLDWESFEKEMKSRFIRKVEEEKLIK